MSFFREYPIYIVRCTQTLHIVVNIFNWGCVLVTAATCKTFMMYSHKPNDMIYVPDNISSYRLSI